MLSADPRTDPSTYFAQVLRQSYTHGMIEYGDTARFTIVVLLATSLEAADGQVMCMSDLEYEGLLRELGEQANHRYTCRNPPRPDYARLLLLDPAGGPDGLFWGQPFKRHSVPIPPPKGRPPRT